MICGSEPERERGRFVGLASNSKFVVQAHMHETGKSGKSVPNPPSCTAQWMRKSTKSTICLVTILPSSFLCHTRNITNRENILKRKWVNLNFKTLYVRLNSIKLWWNVRAEAKVLSFEIGAVHLHFGLPLWYMWFLVSVDGFGPSFQFSLCDILLSFRCLLLCSSTCCIQCTFLCPFLSVFFSTSWTPIEFQMVSCVESYYEQQAISIFG